MQRSTSTSDERGQAYTLEGFVSAMVVLMAVLLALQSVVITPTTGGLADRSAKAQLEQEAQDALLIAASEDGGNLSEMVRYWDPDQEAPDHVDYDRGTYHNPSENSGEGYYRATNDTELYENFALGKTLSERFTERGRSYNIELVYQNQDGEFDDEERTYLVYHGKSESVTASYTVTLFESDNLTVEGHEGTSIRDAWEEDNYPIPPAHEDSDASVIYNVVEVRVSVHVN